ncbi:hypothetical protein G8A07_05595 [Roseateles sp. DAIF2]|uniref:substrate-binding periplasmic protein n=1 Tax=Roseateles sp. DAIF2 TaxID=2714952 RepID=UPI0018A28ECC|nr:hypothetical protein [Roseateles sp. DAIF2]QPF72457.1 hypothetical protein G8A07_05595 [Roseateles sp. DAIF2]
MAPTWPCLLALLVAQAAQAADPVSLRLCTADQPFYPFTMPDGSGQHQFLLRLAARKLPLTLDNYMAPRPRCLQDLRQGRADAAVGVFTRERLGYLAYPGRGEQPDAAQGLGEVRFVAYRRVGSAVSWDGERFANLDGGAVGVLFGFAYGPKLEALKLPIDDRAIGHEQLLQKLVRGRNPVVIMQERQGEQLIAQRYAGQVEALEPLFERFTLYLMVGRPYLARHGELVRAYWRAIEAARASAEYRQYRVPAAGLSGS